MDSADFLDDLKLKLSWGKNGNQGIDPYGTLSTVSAGSSGGVFILSGIRDHHLMELNNR